MNSSSVETNLFHQALSVVTDGKTNYYAAPWLTSKFDADVWSASFGQRAMQIDFRVKLENGSLLTSTQNGELLKTLKCWLLAQTHTKITRGLVYASASVANRVSLAVHVCEYLLIQAESLQLSKHGLRLFTESDGSY